MTLSPQILYGTIFHARHVPREHAFSYKLSYLCLPLSQVSIIKTLKYISLNRFNLFGLYEKDHGGESKSVFTTWVESALKEHNCSFDCADVQLITMPRQLGYVFNPITFWCCFDKESKLRAVICEVKNTFGQKHCYLCQNEGGRPIGADDWVTTAKAFYVSPFFEVKGHYQFRFRLSSEKISIWINYFDTNQRLLTTSLMGRCEPLTDTALLKSFWRDPFKTLKVICFIHYQALRLVLKKVRLTKRPPPPESYISQ